MQPIPKLIGYFATKNGDIYSLAEGKNHPKPKTPRKLKKWEANGYWKVSPSNKKRYVHRLVLSAFKGERPTSIQCRHLNGNRKDNRIENLEWGTRSENQMDRVLTGTSNRGEQHPNHKLTKEQVLEIRSIGKSKNYRQIANQFSVSCSAIEDIILGKRWKWL